MAQMSSNHSADQQAPHLLGDMQGDVDERPILFFDGVCGLCNRSVDFVLARDSSKLFLFAPLQGETAARQLNDADTRSLESVVLLERQTCYRRSAATSRVLWKLGGIWRIWATLFWLIPRPLRDIGYQLIARTRYRFFGKRESCRLPTPAEKSRFLP